MEVLLVVEIDLHSSYHEHERSVACLCDWFSTGRQQTSAAEPMTVFLRTSLKTNSAAEPEG